MRKICVKYEEALRQQMYTATRVLIFIPYEFQHVFQYTRITDKKDRPVFLCFQYVIFLPTSLIFVIFQLRSENLNFL